MWIEIVAAFLGLSLLLYCLLGGADFGAGILENFLDSEHQRELVNRAMGPVWEANHMWLVLAVVILFNGFPGAYCELTVTYHIPLTVMLVGVILRGCAFTFRHYDAVRDRSERVYSVVFRISSVLAPLALGVIVGGVLLGRGGPTATTFGGRFVAPWCNLFSFAVGVFTCVLFALIAAIYLVGEADSASLRIAFARRAQWTLGWAIAAGGVVFLAAEADGLQLASRFIHDPVSVTCLGLATALAIPLSRIHAPSSGRFASAIAVRALGGAELALILGGWFHLQYPRLVGDWTIWNAAAPDATLRYLVAALAVGSLLIFPALFYLFWVFKGQTGRAAGN